VDRVSENHRVDIAFNSPERTILGEALLAVFAHALCAPDLSPVTARGYPHDLNKWREWLEVWQARDLRRVPVVDLVTIGSICYTRPGCRQRQDQLPECALQCRRDLEHSVASIAPIQGRGRAGAHASSILRWTGTGLAG
jgi:hypothetical protein